MIRHDHKCWLDTRVMKQNIVLECLFLCHSQTLSSVLPNLEACFKISSLFSMGEGHCGPLFWLCQKGSQ